MIASSKRIPEFDGLRGVAAIVVVVPHIVAAFMPVLFFGPGGWNSSVVARLLCDVAVFRDGFW